MGRLSSKFLISSFTLACCHCLLTPSHTPQPPHTMQGCVYYPPACVSFFLPIVLLFQFALLLHWALPMPGGCLPFHLFGLLLSSGFIRSNQCFVFSSSSCYSCPAEFSLTQDFLSHSLSAFLPCLEDCVLIY